MIVAKREIEIVNRIIKYFKAQSQSIYSTEEILQKLEDFRDE